MISIKDVKNVARDLKIKVTAAQAKEVLERYPDEQELEQCATWDIVVEHLLYQITEG